MNNSDIWIRVCFEVPSMKPSTIEVPSIRPSTKAPTKICKVKDDCGPHEECPCPETMGEDEWWEVKYEITFYKI